MQTEKPARASGFPVTWRGGIAFMCGSVFFAAGIARGELASALCGALLLGFFFFSLAIVAVASFHWRSTSAVIIWEPDKTRGLRAECRASDGRPRRMALARIVCAIRYACGGKHPFAIDVPIKGATTAWKPKLPPRGVYEAVSVAIQVSDFSGFFLFSLKPINRETPEALVIPPTPEPAEGISWPPGKTGSVRGKSVFKRSDELFDSRPYHSGDDPRKINWKQFAHTANLAVKQGDLLPPPSEEFLFAINANSETYANADEISRFSALINKVAWLVIRLLDENKIVSVAFLGDDGQLKKATAFPGDPTERQKILSALAIPQLSGGEGFVAPDIRAQPGVTNILVTLPDDAYERQGLAPLRDFDLILVGPKPNLAPELTLSRIVRMALFTEKVPYPRKQDRAFGDRLRNFVEALRSGDIDVETV